MKRSVLKVGAPTHGSDAGSIPARVIYNETLCSLTGESDWL